MFRGTGIYAVGIMVLSLLAVGCSGDKTPSASTHFTGKWIGSAQKTGSSNPTMELEIREEDGQLSGVLSTLDGTFRSAVLADMRVVDGSLVFRAVANGDTQFKGHLYLFSLGRVGDGIEGTWTDVLEGAEGPLSLTADTR